ncbi:MAG: RluA family pseudouridine synthase [Bacteroidales bacterium]
MKGNNTDIAGRVLYEDNHLLIVNKLPSEIVQGDKTGDVPLSDILKEYIRIKYHKPGEAFLGVVHRIDRPVSGALVFARTSKALTRMNEMVRTREMKKIYWAVTTKQPPSEQGTLVHYLRKNEEKNKSFVFDQPLANTLQAELRYSLISASDKYFLLEIDLVTGRHHQIRAQLAAMGCPVKGDLKYGAPRSNPDGSIHLHSRYLSFIHPVKKEMLSFTADPPDDPLWNFFTRNNSSGL